MPISASNDTDSDAGGDREMEKINASVPQLLLIGSVEILSK
jgi:hypothetical protein